MDDVGKYLVMKLIRKDKYGVAGWCMEIDGVKGSKIDEYGGLWMCMEMVYSKENSRKPVNRLGKKKMMIEMMGEEEEEEDRFTCETNPHQWSSPTKGKLLEDL